MRLYIICIRQNITLKDASHGHWYYNGDEFGGIFKGLYDSIFSLASGQNISFDLSLFIGKGETTNDVQHRKNNQFDEVGRTY